MTIPRGPQDVTPAWLGSVLGADVADRRRHPDRHRPDRRHLPGAATYSHSHTDLPATFAVKLSAQDDAVRERVALGYRSEVEYYARVADRMSIPVPPCFYSRDLRRRSRFRPRARRHGARGARRSDRRMQRAGGGLAVEALAGLHGPSWCDPEWMDLAGIAMPKPGDDAAAGGLGEISQMAAGILVDKLGGDISAEDQETLTAAMSLVTPWLMAEPERYALMHGDYRLDNMLFDPDRTRITVVDWQTVGIGLPGSDLAYFTATSLDPDVRSDIEQDLVGQYHRALLGYGITDYDFDTCWRDYRLGVVQAPLLTGLGFAFAASTERGDEMMLTMLHRGCRAIRELETLDLIKSYQAT